MKIVDRLCEAIACGGFLLLVMGMAHGNDISNTDNVDSVHNVRVREPVPAQEVHRSRGVGRAGGFLQAWRWPLGQSD